MKAELVKRQDRWDLYGEDGSKKASSAPNPIGKLSIENCESIANGYDLEQMSIEKYDPTYVPSMFINFEIDCKREGFIEGCKAIIELLGDKKFSEEDLVSFGKRCFYKGFEKSENDDANCYTAFREEIGELIQSQQQTEWDVEIVTEQMNLYELREQVKSFSYCNTSKPKLDENGCLILKRKK